MLARRFGSSHTISMGLLCSYNLIEVNTSLTRMAAAPFPPEFCPLLAHARLTPTSPLRSPDDRSKAGAAALDRARAWRLRSHVEKRRQRGNIGQCLERKRVGRNG